MSRTYVCVIDRHEYFRQIAITERLNKRQQRQRMPERYWCYLVEDVDENRLAEKGNFLSPEN